MTKHSRRFVSTLVMGMMLAAPFFWGTAVASNRIDSVRLHRAPDHTRVVFDLPAPVSHELNKLSDPYRIVLDLDQSELDFDMNTLDVSGSPVSGVRVGQHANARTRVVFDLKEDVRPRTLLLKPVEPYGHRLVLDLYDKHAASVKTIEDVATAPSGARKMVVAIDAGHGGEDPGALGPTGAVEKVIVLQIAKRLYDMVKQEPGMEPVMVRSGDYYVPLADRRKIAWDKYRADVFISIHADAFTDARAHGASVFALSQRGATSATARYLARVSNQSDAIAGVAEEEQQNTSLLSVLADMKMTGQLSHSLKLGENIVHELGKVTPLHGGRRKVEQAGFAVLKEPEMVSVLVETGFISNRKEEKNLRSASHQQKLANAIFNGVRKYASDYPAPGTLYAMARQQGERVYHIQPGDTLSEIARRYRTSTDALQKINNLNGDAIVVGQVLQLP